jgi:hypothetical protein
MRRLAKARPRPNVRVGGRGPVNSHLEPVKCTEQLASCVFEGYEDGLRTVRSQRAWME